MPTETTKTTERYPFPNVCRCPVPGASRTVTFNAPPGERERRITTKLDACIAGLVLALNAGGLYTTESCCGHGGTVEAFIALADGRRLVIQ